jgi:hypothetical protein
VGTGGRPPPLYFITPCNLRSASDARGGADPAGLEAGLQGVGDVKSGGASWLEAEARLPLGGAGVFGVEDPHNGRGFPKDPQIAVVNDVINFAHLEGGKILGGLIGGDRNGTIGKHRLAILEAVSERNERAQHVLGREEQVKEHTGKVLVLAGPYATGRAIE